MTVRYLQEQADRAERLAKAVLDVATCEVLMKYARECRERADVAVPFTTIARGVDKEDRAAPPNSNVPRLY